MGERCSRWSRGPVSHSDPEERAGNLGRSSPGRTGEVASRCGSQRPPKFEAALWGSREPWTRGGFVCLPAHRPGRVVSPTCAAPWPITFLRSTRPAPLQAPLEPLRWVHIWMRVVVTGGRCSCLVIGSLGRETHRLLRDKPHWQGLLSLCSDLSFNKLLLSSSCLHSVLLSSAGDKAQARSPFRKASQPIRGRKTYACLQVLQTLRKGGGGTPRRAAPTFVQIWGKASTGKVQMAGCGGSGVGWQWGR